MNKLLTPKQVARAIQVSESSVKRWCDKGVIANQRTAGGHRRIALTELLEFLRRSDRTLARPELVGLPATTGQTNRVVDRAAGQLTEALLQGDEQQCVQISLDLYLAHHSLSKICDEIFAPAFTMIGLGWERGNVEVYQERRGCEIALRVLHELRALVPAPPDDAPLAIGGAWEGDPYQLGTAMAELVLRDGQWNAVSLGNNLPLHTLESAIEHHRPRLFWISCSSLLDEGQFVQGYAKLYEQFGRETAFVVGGRSLVDSIRQHMKYAAYCDQMQHLEAFAHTLRQGDARGRSSRKN
jgi:excisionase family DNA binding protein